MKTLVGSRSRSAAVTLERDPTGLKDFAEDAEEIAAEDFLDLLV